MVLGDERITAHQERLKGYRSALANHGIRYDEKLVLRAFTHSSGAYEETKRIFSEPNPPDGLFITNNQLTIRVLPALQELGVRLSADVLVACFDDLPLADVLNPGLTAVQQPTYDLGRRAAELLLDRIESPIGVTREVLLTPRLIVRGSSRRPANTAS